MAFARKLTADGDLEYTAGSQALVEGTDAQQQAFRQNLRTLRGEYIFHPTVGLDIQALRSGGDATIAAAVRSAALRSGRVERVIQVQRDPDEPAHLARARRRRFMVRAVLRSGQEVQQGLVV